MEFVFSGNIPTMGDISGLKAVNRYTGKQFGGETNFNGGDPGLQYRFWNPAENGYAGSGIDKADNEVLAEEAAFLGLENLFACRKQCKADQGGFPSLRQCIRDCKGKGPKASVLKAKDLEIQEKIAGALTQQDDSARTAPVSGSKTMMWVIIGFVALIIIGLLIYFLTRKKAVPAVA